MKTFQEIQDEIIRLDENALFADGFEDALVGYVSHPSVVLAAYDREKCIKILMERDRMSMEEAEDCFSFNTENAWVGIHTPVFLTQMRSV